MSEMYTSLPSVENVLKFEQLFLSAFKYGGNEK